MIDLMGTGKLVVRSRNIGHSLDLGLDIGAELADASNCSSNWLL